MLLHAGSAVFVLVMFVGKPPEPAVSPEVIFTVVDDEIGSAPVRSSAPTAPMSLHLPAPVVRPHVPTPSAPASPHRLASAPGTAPAAASSPSPRMSIDEFRRRQGTAIPSAKPTPSRAIIPKVSESFSVPSSHGAPALSEGPADPGFASGLLRDLREAFVGAGIKAAGLSAEVGFLLAANGSLEAVRIRRSSGDAAFDAAVIAAFRDVRARGFSAEAVGKSYQVTFRIADE